MANCMLISLLWIYSSDNNPLQDKYTMCINNAGTSSNGNIFRVNGPFWGEFTSYRWIPATIASDAEHCCFDSLIYAWTDGWVHNRDAGDLRRHRAHYNVNVMCLRRKAMNSNCIGSVWLYNIYEYKHTRISCITVALRGKNITYEYKIN